MAILTNHLFPCNLALLHCNTETALSKATKPSDLPTNSIPFDYTRKLIPESLSYLGFCPLPSLVLLLPLRGLLLAPLWALVRQVLPLAWPFIDDLSHLHCCSYSSLPATDSSEVPLCESPILHLQVPMSNIPSSCGLRQHYHLVIFFPHQPYQDSPLSACVSPMSRSRKLLRIVPSCQNSLEEETRGA